MNSKTLIVFQSSDSAQMSQFSSPRIPSDNNVLTVLFACLKAPMLALIEQLHKLPDFASPVSPVPAPVPFVLSSDTSQPCQDLATMDQQFIANYAAAAPDLAGEEAKQQTGFCTTPSGLETLASECYQQVHRFGW
jgi:hypothetical protein